MVFLPFPCLTLYILQYKNNISNYNDWFGISFDAHFVLFSSGSFCSVINLCSKNLGVDWPTWYLKTQNYPGVHKHQYYVEYLWGNVLGGKN